MRSPLFIALFASVLLSTPVLAQSSGFALDRLQPAPTSEDGLAVILPRTLGHLRPSFGLTLDYAHQPLVIARPSNDPDLAPVKHRLVGHFSAALGLGSRFEVFVRAPVLFMQRGDSASANIGGQSAAHSGAFGALQLGASARLLGADDGPFAVGATAWVETPTGSREHLAGDHGGGGGGVLSASYNTKWFGLAANVGGRYRPKDSFGTARIGSELLLGTGAYLYATEHVTILGELNGVLSLRDAGAATQSLPFELLAGARYATPLNMLLTGAAGLGLSQAIGVPDARALLQLAYPNPRPARRSADVDHDGIPNRQDDCPERAEDTDGFQDQDGCPELDNDQDGIADTRDQCVADPEDLDGSADDDGCPEPDHDHRSIVDAEPQCPNATEGMYGSLDEDGCPNLDSDRDGLVGPGDRCPLQPEDLDGFEDTDGCPDPDNDKDGVLDLDDGCPTVPGPAAAHGCPSAVRIDKQQIRILERLEFQTRRAEIRPESLGVLDQVREALEVNPQLRRVRIEGHTDGVGSTAANKKLSQRRAESVMTYLIKEGIDPSRVEAKGWGEERPLVKNDSAENKQINRRVEFHIVEPAPPESSPGGAK